MKHTQKRLKFKRVKLGRQGLHGLADEYPLLIDSRLTGKKELEIILHEAWHYLFPEMTEEQVVRMSVVMTNTLWAENYRKVDNSNDIPLQDGSI